MTDTNYERYLVRTPLYKADAGFRDNQSPVMTLLSPEQIPEANYDIQLEWIIGIPGKKEIREYKNDYDVIILFLSGNHKTPQVLGAEIGLSIGSQAVSFNTSAGIFIPKGIPHSSFTWKEFFSPHIQMTIKINNSNAVLSESKLPEKDKEFDYEQYVIRSPMREAGAEFKDGRTSPTMTYMSGVQIPGVRFYIELGWTFGMPVSNRQGSAMPEMVHKKYEEIVLHIGGDPENHADLGADMEFHVGGQPLSFNTTSALFIPRGVSHGPIRCKAYRKPHIVMAIMCGAGTVKEGWEDSFITDRNNK